MGRVVEGSGWRPKWRGFQSEGAWTAPSEPPPEPDCAGGARARTRRGIGIACSAYLTGAGTAVYWNNMPHSGVILRADRSGGVAVLCGAADIGPGSGSMLAYLPAGVLGIDPEDVHLPPPPTRLN